MSTWTWTDSMPLHQYSHAFSMPGLYVIGQSRDANGTPTSSGIVDPYLLTNWPDNFKPEYVGISEANVPGVKGRLSCHSRKKGSKHVASLLEAGVNLFFIAIYGMEITEYEALYIALKTHGQFEGNVRDEKDRVAAKRFNKIRAEMTQTEQDFYDNLDAEHDGM